MIDKNYQYNANIKTFDNWSMIDRICSDHGICFPLGVFLSQVSAEHLLAASCMSAPAALMIAKIIFPDDVENRNEEQKLKLEKPQVS